MPASEQPAADQAPDAPGCPRIDATTKTHGSLPGSQLALILTHPSASDTSSLVLSPDAPIEIVFDAWREATGHQRAKLDPKRRKILKQALQTYGLDDCVAAAKGVALSDWHSGRDSKTDGRKYDSLELVFRDAEKTERFIELAREAEKPPCRVQDAQNDLYRAFCAFVEHIQFQEHVPLGDELTRSTSTWPAWLRPDQQVTTTKEFGSVEVPRWSLEHIRETDRNDLVAQIHFRAAARWAGRWACETVLPRYDSAEWLRPIAEEYRDGTIREFADLFARCKAVTPIFHAEVSLEDIF